MTPVDLSFTSHGEGDPPLVLLHGYMASNVDYAEIEPTLAQSRRVISLDHRGHGGSPKTAGAYSFDHLVTDVTHSLSRHGIERIHLMGHSMGGVIALRIAIEHPELVASLVLMDTAAEPAGKLPLWLVNAVGGIGRITGMGAPLSLATKLARGHSSDHRARAREKFAALDPEAFTALARELNVYPSMVSRLPQIAVATTVLVGEKDTGLRRSAEVLAAQIPHARLVVIADAGHNPQHDQPQACIQALRDHFEGLPS